MLQIASAIATLVPHFDFIGDTIAIGVSIALQIKRVGLANDHAVQQRQNHTRKGKVIGKNGVLVVDAIAIGVFVS